MHTRPKIQVGDVVRISHRALRRGKYGGWLGRTFVVIKVTGNGTSYNSGIQCVIDFDTHANHTFYRSDLWRTGHNILKPTKCDECGHLFPGHGIICSKNPYCGYCGRDLQGSHSPDCRGVINLDTNIRFTYPTKTPAAPMQPHVYSKFQKGDVDALGRCYWHGTTDCEHLKTHG